MGTNFNLMITGGFDDRINSRFMKIAWEKLKAYEPISDYCRLYIHYLCFGISWHYLGKARHIGKWKHNN